MKVRVIGVAASVAVLAVTVLAVTVSAAKPDSPGKSDTAGRLDMCISVNGDEKVQKGTATCDSSEGDGAANVACAKGKGAIALAGFVEGASGNRATASGDDSTASAGAGDGSTATASGDRHHKQKRATLRPKCSTR